jgi:hypothetical protein
MVGNYIYGSQELPSAPLHSHTRERACVPAYTHTHTREHKRTHTHAHTRKPMNGFACVVPTALRSGSVQAVLLCYDISNYQSFQNLEDW